MKVLFLYGWHSVPCGVKPTYLAENGLEIVNPALDDDDFGAALATAQAAFDEHQPQVVVGSSRARGTFRSAAGGAGVVPSSRCRRDEPQERERFARVALPGVAELGHSKDVPPPCINASRTSVLREPNRRRHRGKSIRNAAWSGTALWVFSANASARASPSRD